MIEASGGEPGAAQKFEMIAQGKWKINGNEILESIEKLSITSFSVNNQELPPSSFPQEIKDAMVGKSSRSEIIQLDDRALITKNAGTQITCSRM